MYCQKGALKISVKFTKKTLAPKSHFNKVAGQRRAPLLKRRLWQRYFLVSFAKFLRTTVA